MLAYYIFWLFKLFLSSLLILITVTYYFWVEITLVHNTYIVVVVIEVYISKPPFPKLDYVICEQPLISFCTIKFQIETIKLKFMCSFLSRCCPKEISFSYQTAV